MVLTFKLITSAAAFYQDLAFLDIKKGVYFILEGCSAKNV